MAEMATYIGIVPRTVQNSSGTLLKRGTRVTMQSTGLVAQQDNTARGDFVLLTDLSPNDVAAAASMEGGGKVPALASVACNIGDPAYTATAGQFSNVAASNILVGRWTQPASGAGVLSEVELLNPL